MAHGITVRENGRAEAYYALKPAWHGLGTVTPEALTSADAIKAAGLLWEVEQHPLQTTVLTEVFGTDGNPSVEMDIVPVPNMVANVRSDNHKVLGVVSTLYKPVQNVEAFDFVDGLVAENAIRYEAAGSLRGGRTVWLLARMPESQQVAEGDTTDQYILFVNGHSGNRAIRVMPTAVRVVCQNTLNLATSRTQGERGLTIPHIGDIRRKLDAARHALGLVKEEFDRYGEMGRRMAERKMIQSERSAFVWELFPDVPGSKNTLRSKARNEINTLMRHPAQQVGGIGGTAWSAFNAVTHYVDHKSRRIGKTPETKAENRMGSVLMGAGAQLKAKAWEQAAALLA